MLADHTKWGVVGISAIARLDEAEMVITDSQLAADARETLEPTLRLLVVDPAEPARAAAQSRVS